ncbi:MAG: stage V sporulation protein AB [Planifilum sp.]|jgi:stage V sporulation protein AB
MILKGIALIFIGLAGGLAVGSGFVAFITVLDIIPRLAQMSKTEEKICTYENALIIGALVSTWIDFFDWNGHFSGWLLAFLGLFAGCFVGLLAASLTEVLNVLPILAKRLRIQHAILHLLMAMAFGKVAGSLLQWILF